MWACASDWPIKVFRSLLSKLPCLSPPAYLLVQLPCHWESFCSHSSLTYSVALSKEVRQQCFLTRAWIHKSQFTLTCAIPENQHPKPPEQASGYPEDFTQDHWDLRFPSSHQILVGHDASCPYPCGSLEPPEQPLNPGDFVFSWILFTNSITINPHSFILWWNIAHHQWIGKYLKRYIGKNNLIDSLIGDIWSPRYNKVKLKDKKIMANIGLLNFLMKIILCQLNKWN